MFTSSHECGLCIYVPYKLFDGSWIVIGCSSKRSIIPLKEPPAEFSGYGTDLTTLQGL